MNTRRRIGDPDADQGEPIATVVLREQGPLGVCSTVLKADYDTWGRVVKSVNLLPH
jgi:hypothetical protein